MLAGSIPANTITAMASDTVIFADSGDMEGYTGEAPVQETDPAEQNNSDDLLVYDNSPDMIEEDYQTDPSGSMVFTHGGEDEGEPAQDQLTEEASIDGGEELSGTQAEPRGETVATVITSAGTVEYDSFGAAWEAAVTAARTEGSAEMDLVADWVSDETGRFGTGACFSGEGSIVMDAPSGKLLLQGNGHKITGKGSARLGGCIIGVFSGNLEIQFAHISGGNSTSDGGGILVLGGNVTLDHVELGGNKAGTGAGLCATGGSVTLKDCEITNNTAEKKAGGIFVDTDNASLTLEGRMLVTGNTAEAAPGVFLGGSAPITMDKLSAESALTVTCDGTEGSRFIGSASADILGCFEGADANYVITSENGNLYWTAKQPEAAAEEAPAEEPEGNPDKAAAESASGIAEETEDTENAAGSTAENAPNSIDDASDENAIGTAEETAPSDNQDGTAPENAPYSETEAPAENADGNIEEAPAEGNEAVIPTEAPADESEFENAEETPAADKATKKLLCSPPSRKRGGQSLGYNVSAALKKTTEI